VLPLTVFAPISMDLYLPVLPALTTQLGAATSTAQLTVTACLIDLAAGQLLAGPLSDRVFPCGPRGAYPACVPGAGTGHPGSRAPRGDLTDPYREETPPCRSPEARWTR